MGLGAEEEPEGGLLPLHLQLWYGSVTLLALFFYEPVLASPLYRRPSWLPLAALPVALRECFVLCQLEGVSGPEAARALGIRPGTLYRRIHDARQRLRAAVGEGT